MYFFKKKKPAVKSVDTILASFNKAIEELQACTEHNRAESGRLSTQISELHQKMTNCTAEANRANVVAEKIKALVS
jgi:phage shock protein A